MDETPSAISAASSSTLRHAPSDDDAFAFGFDSQRGNMPVGTVSQSLNDQMDGSARGPLGLQHQPGHRRPPNRHSSLPVLSGTPQRYGAPETNPGAHNQAGGEAGETSTPSASQAAALPAVWLQRTSRPAESTGELTPASFIQARQAMMAVQALERNNSGTGMPSRLSLQHNSRMSMESDLGRGGYDSGRNSLTVSIGGGLNSRGSTSQLAALHRAVERLMLQDNNLYAKVQASMQGISSLAKETSKLQYGRDASGATCINQYVVVKTLGRGSFGKVKLCLNTLDGQLYAIKMVNRAHLMKQLQKPTRILRRKVARNPSDNLLQPGGGSSSGGPRSSMDVAAASAASSGPGRHSLDDTNPIAAIMREIAVMKKMDHPHVVKLHEVIDPPGSAYMMLVMEYCEGGCVLETRGQVGFDKFPEAAARDFFRQACLGLDYLHYHRVVHGDLKPENLLVDACGSLKLADFGSSRVVGGDPASATKTSCTPAFQSPEEVGRLATDPFAADAWALGCCLYCFVFGRLPFVGSCVVDIYRAILTQELEIPSEPAISDELRHLLQYMLAKDPRVRASLADAMAHPWTTAHGAEPLTSLRTLGAEAPEVIQVSTAEQVNAIDRSSLVAMIRARLKEKAYAKGEFLFRAGEEAHCVYMIMSGVVEVVRPAGPEDVNLSPHHSKKIHVPEQQGEGGTHAHGHNGSNGNGQQQSVHGKHHHHHHHHQQNPHGLQHSDGANPEPTAQMVAERSSLFSTVTATGANVATDSATPLSHMSHGTGSAQPSAALPSSTWAAEVTPDMSLSAGGTGRPSTAVGGGGGSGGGGGEVGEDDDDEEGSLSVDLDESLTLDLPPAEAAAILTGGSNVIDGKLHISRQQASEMRRRVKRSALVHGGGAAPEYVLHVKGPGQVVGEVSLDTAPTVYSYSARAKEAVVCVRLTEEAFIKALLQMYEAGGVSAVTTASSLGESSGSNVITSHLAHAASLGGGPMAMARNNHGPLMAQAQGQVQAHSRMAGMTTAAAAQQLSMSAASGCSPGGTNPGHILSSHASNGGGVSSPHAAAAAAMAAASSLFAPSASARPAGMFSPQMAQVMQNLEDSGPLPRVSMPPPPAASTGSGLTSLSAFATQAPQAQHAHANVPGLRLSGHTHALGPQSTGVSHVLSEASRALGLGVGAGSRPGPGLAPVIRSSGGCIAPGATSRMGTNSGLGGGNGGAPGPNSGFAGDVDEVPTTGDNALSPALMQLGVLHTIRSCNASRAGRESHVVADL